MSRFTANMLSGSEKVAEEAKQAREAAGVEHPTFKGEPALKGSFVTKENHTDGGQKGVGPCRACQEIGRDAKGKHLVIYPSGHFSCIGFPATAIETPERAAHMKRVWQLHGMDMPSMKPPVPMDPEKKARRQALVDKAISIWSHARVQYTMTLEEWQKLSGPLPTTAEESFRAHCRQYRPGEIGWIGHRFDCDADFKRHLYEPATEADRGWKMACTEGLDHTNGLIRKPGMERGKKGAVKDDDGNPLRAFIPVEHDGVCIEEQIALTRYLQAEVGLTLNLAVHTTNRGFHAHFDGRGVTQARLDLIILFLNAIGADYGVTQRCDSRTPGAVRQWQPPEQNKDGTFEPTKPYGSVQPIIFINPTI